ncbi:hypothetical protein [Rhodococcus pyridinivorans]|uniref:Uncharacterized protein n=1 Tax=Rhodococcus pyridinivorans AK37 TaxID=1114960 RepID=H0JSV9_9NOCA|nr:hypothetical protein [Rhodococcus pyridinivorans]EHK82872.1 hypothetical protein AK37_13851 [Rhodococcus pyridinivorans AK37]MCD2143257.1 hypothetical protein [Rhodococcus pyridinivorans]
MSTPIPRPGEHLPGARPTVDPAHVRKEVDALLARVREGASVPGAESADQSVLLEQADLLERAHEVLVQALSTVDKI